MLPELEKNDAKMNKVFRTEDGTIPLSNDELAYEACLIPYCRLTSLDYPGRIAGEGHCRCRGNGEFVLLPIDDPDVQEGGKRYMQCRKCGCWSHL